MSHVLPLGEELELGMQSCRKKQEFAYLRREWDLIIQPRRHLFDINFYELWEYRDLVLMFVKRDIVTQYKQTILGPIWYFLQPLMTMLVYVVVFGNIANIPTDGIPKPLFYLAGITMWNYFFDCFNQTSDTFIKNAQIFGKVYFPRLLLPLSKVISGLIKFLIQTVLFWAILLFYIENGVDVHLGKEIFLTPYLVLLMALIGFGSGIIFSSLTTKYRDLTFLITFGIQLLMYATPIIYPMSTIPERYIPIVWLNPMTHIIEAYKLAFLGSGTFTFLGMVYTSILTAVIVFVGIFLFNRTEQNFMDTV